MKYRSNKNFKTLDEQIDILRYKGMIVNNEEYTKEILLRENYFFLNGYRHLFLRSESDRRFIEGTTFEELYSLFLFDRQFRNIVFKNLLIIENNLKSIISYQLSKKYGYKENDYLKPKNFTDDPYKTKQVNDLIHKMKRQIRVNGLQHSATMHYINNYGYIPLWVLVKVLSFGIVGELYAILKREDQLAIANRYRLSIEDFIDYLPILANYRNLCAHEDILYNNRTQKSILDTKYHRLLNIPIMDNEYIYGKNDLFSVVIMMKSMIKKDEFDLFEKEISDLIDELDNKLKSIEINKILDCMGFPKNWKELKDIDKKEIF